MDNFFDPKTRELFVYDFIGSPNWFGISAVDFVGALKELGPGDIHVRLNSPGGTADEAFAAVELLKRHDGQVNVSVDSLAASAATFFLDKSFSVTAAPTARIMIHRAMTLTYGNAKDHAKTIDILNTYDASVAKVYSRMKATPEEINDLMDAETWMTAAEALEWELIDSINESAKDVPAAKIRNGLYKHTPDDLLLTPKARTELAKPPIETPNRTAASLRMRQIAAVLRRP